MFVGRGRNAKSINKTEAKTMIPEYFGEKSNVHVHFLSEVEGVKFPKIYGTKEMERSNQIYLALKHESKKRAFDAFLFHDYRGVAATTIQAKRSGLPEFQNTAIIVTCHTSSYNSAFFNARSASKDDAVLNELEDYTRNYADLVIFVSRALRDQLAKLSIYDGLATAPARTVVLPNFVYGEMYDALVRNDFGRKVPTKFAFFGRLDTLKGIDTFVDAVHLLVRKLHSDEGEGGEGGEASRSRSRSVPRLEEIAIIGDYPSKPDRVRQMIDDLFEKLKGCGIATVQYNDLMTVPAVNKMLEEGYVAVLPSLYENYPMALLEMLTFGVPVIHADAGGQSEVSAGNLNMFSAGVASDLARVMHRVLKEGITQDVPAIPRDEVLEGYVKAMSLDPRLLAPKRSMKSAGKVASEGCSDVTVAIVTFLGRIDDVTDLLNRLVEQTCSDFSVIVFVNSPCDKNRCGLELGSAALAHFAGPKLRMLTPPGGGTVSVAEARNTMLRDSKTEFTILFDDDDVPRRDFVKVMRRAAIYGSADLVTSHAGFLEERPSREDVAKSQVKLHHVSLAGGNTGPGGNFFVHHTGKANVLLRTSVAQSLGPCLPELSISTSPFVDWGMYTNFILNKTTIGVVPESMYYYKMHSKGSIFYGASEFNKYLGAKKIVNKYCEYYNLDIMGCDILWMSKQMA
jgi:glycosyltransferase involved in cell wall biosynthesis